jgi:hypothetical protein
VFFRHIFAIFQNTNLQRIFVEACFICSEIMRIIRGKQNGGKMSTSCCVDGDQKCVRDVNRLEVLYEQSFNR